MTSHFLLTAIFLKDFFCRLIAPFVGTSVIGHGIVAGSYITKCCNLLVVNCWCMRRQSVVMDPKAHEPQDPMVINDDAHHLAPTLLRGMIEHGNSGKESKRYLSGISANIWVHTRWKSIPPQITCVDSHSWFGSFSWVLAMIPLGHTDTLDHVFTHTRAPRILQEHTLLVDGWDLIFAHLK